MTEMGLRDGNVTHLEMNGASDPHPILEMGTRITLKTVIYKVSRSLLN